MFEADSEEGKCCLFIRQQDWAESTARRARDPNMWPFTLILTVNLSCENKTHVWQLYHNDIRSQLSALGNGKLSVIWISVVERVTKTNPIKRKVFFLREASYKSISLLLGS